MVVIKYVIFIHVELKWYSISSRVSPDGPRYNRDMRQGSYLFLACWERNASQKTRNLRCAYFTRQFKPAPFVLFFYHNATSCDWIVEIWQTKVCAVPRFHRHGWHPQRRLQRQHHGLAKRQQQGRSVHHQRPRGRRVYNMCHEGQLHHHRWRKGSVHNWMGFKIDENRTTGSGSVPLPFPPPIFVDIKWCLLSCVPSF